MKIIKKIKIIFLINSGKIIECFKFSLNLGIYEIEQIFNKTHSKLTIL